MVWLEKSAIYVLYYRLLHALVIHACASSLNKI